MVNKKMTFPTTNRGQISVWLILFMVVTLSALLIIFSPISTIVGSTNKITQQQNNASVSDLDLDNCLLTQHEWRNLHAKYSHDSLALIDNLREKINKDCTLNDDVQKALLNFLLVNQPEHSMELIQEFIPDENMVNTINYEHSYQQYQIKKQELKYWVEDNLLPGESFEERYSKELIQLQNEIFN